MKIALTNLGPEAMTIASADGTFTSAIGSMETKTFEDPSTVWVVGFKASILENIKKSVGIVVEAITKLFSEPKEGEQAHGVLSFKVQNEGAKEIRVIPGAVELEFNLVPGERRDTTGLDYMEIRELGA